MANRPDTPEDHRSELKRRAISNLAPPLLKKAQPKTSLGSQNDHSQTNNNAHTAPRAPNWQRHRKHRTWPCMGSIKEQMQRHCRVGRRRVYIIPERSRYSPLLLEASDHLQKSEAEHQRFRPHNCQPFTRHRTRTHNNRSVAGIAASKDREFHSASNSPHELSNNDATTMACR